MHNKALQLAAALGVAAALAACNGNTDTDTVDRQDGRDPASPAIADRDMAGTSGDQGGTATGTQGSSTTTGTAGRTAGATGTDQDFARFVANTNTAEVELGKLAQQRASNNQVKQFAEQMVNDHTKANAELRQAAGSTLVPSGRELDAKHQQLREKLMKLSGAEFDREYMTAMVDGHQDAISRFEQQAKAESGQLKNFAEKTLPTLRQHLQQAQRIQSHVASSGTGTAGRDASQPGSSPGTGARGGSQGNQPENRER
jgi:putative membrane protein